MLWICYLSFILIALKVIKGAFGGVMVNKQV